MISLFGEQVTKQFLSESTSVIDNFIFALAPLGILTAVVSAIRVSTNLPLKAFIGRAQEGRATAEVELLSCTSDTVSELWEGGGVARVFGEPKVLEVVKRTSNLENAYMAGGDAGISQLTDIFRWGLDRTAQDVNDPSGSWSSDSSAKVEQLTNEAIGKNASDRWAIDESRHALHRSSAWDESEELMSSDFAEFTSRPNLALNVGRMTRPPWYSISILSIGITLQIGITIQRSLGSSNANTVE